MTLQKIVAHSVLLLTNSLTFNLTILKTSNSRLISCKSLKLLSSSIVLLGINSEFTVSSAEGTKLKYMYKSWSYDCDCSTSSLRTATREKRFAGNELRRVSSTQVKRSLPHPQTLHISSEKLVDVFIFLDE